jgi:hypothetical protein
MGDATALAETSQISYFDPVVIEFLKELSSAILLNPLSRNHGDVLAFAYWIRASNLDSAIKNYSVELNRTGYGMCLHIAPANVPLNFAYSLTCSLLAGNRNVVRVPSRKFPQVDFLLEHMREIIASRQFKAVAHAICIVRYEKNDQVTRDFLKFSNVKVVWGGDKTVTEIRSIQTPAHCKEVVFSDRKSASIIDVKSLTGLSEIELLNLAEKFYTDTYLFDQNACSSPRVLFWISNPENLHQKERFWRALTAVAEARNSIEPRNLLLKFTELAKIVMTSDSRGIGSVPGAKLSRVKLSLNEAPLSSQLTNRFGTFFEHDVAILDELSPILDNRIQTITYFGVEPKRIVDLVIQNRMKGVDRIVPVGKALDFELRWDGYDLPRTLSRVVTFI